jgi:hypothetical protein
MSSRRLELVEPPKRSKRAFSTGLCHLGVALQPSMGTFDLDRARLFQDGPPESMTILRTPLVVL